jgi:hypothetical protein
MLQSQFCTEHNATVTILYVTQCYSHHSVGNTMLQSPFYTEHNATFIILYGTRCYIHNSPNFLFGRKAVVGCNDGQSTKHRLKFLTYSRNIHSRIFGIQGVSFIVSTSTSALSRIKAVPEDKIRDGCRTDRKDKTLTLYYIQICKKYDFPYSYLLVSHMSIASSH